MDRERYSAWIENVQFFSSCHSTPALVDAELTVDIGCMAFDGFRGNVELKGDLFNAQRPA